MINVIMEVRNDVPFWVLICMDVVSSSDLKYESGFGDGFG